VKAENEKVAALDFATATEAINIIGDMAGILPLGRTALPLKVQTPVSAAGTVSGHS
jgi:hypothetical protein